MTDVRQTGRLGDVPDEKSRPVTPRPAVPPRDDPAVTQPTSVSWRVPGRVLVSKLVVFAIVLMLGLLLARDPLGLWLAAVAAVAVGIYALRDILAPVRLAADREGVTVVTGFAGRRQIPWRDVERIRVDRSARVGLRAMLEAERTALLEIDTGSSLHLFGTSELGAPVDEVAKTLRHLRTGH